MKDEFKGKTISEFVGLKSKIYSLNAINGEEVKKAKRVNKNAVKNTRHKMRRIQRKLHRRGTYNVRKLSLSCFDDRRYILDDGINSFSYFCKYVNPERFYNTIILSRHEQVCLIRLRFE